MRIRCAISVVFLKAIVIAYNTPGWIASKRTSDGSTSSSPLLDAFNEEKFSVRNFELLEVFLVVFVLDRSVDEKIGRLG
jgi:hypothetical protein